MPRGRPRIYQGPLMPNKKSAAVPKALKPTAKAKPKTEKKYTLTTPMRTLVDRRVNKHLETKEIRYLLFNPTNGAGDTAYTLRNAISDLSIKPLMPRLSQLENPEGNAPHRIGNTIHPTSLIVRVKLYLSPDDDPQGVGAADRGAIQPYLFVGHNKNIRNTVQLQENNYNTTIPYVWRFENNSTQDAPADQGIAFPFVGARRPYVQGRLNTTLLRPIKGGVKQPVMIRPVGYYQNPVASEGGGGFATHHIERNYIFNVPVPKKLKYNNNLDDFPDNFAPFLMCGFTYVNGANPSEQAPLRMEASATFKFKDA